MWLHTNKKLFNVFSIFNETWVLACSIWLIVLDPIKEDQPDEAITDTQNYTGYAIIWIIMLFAISKDILKTKFLQKVSILIYFDIVNWAYLLPVKVYESCILSYKLIKQLIKVLIKLHFKWKSQWRCWRTKTKVKKINNFERNASEINIFNQTESQVSAWRFKICHHSFTIIFHICFIFRVTDVFLVKFIKLFKVTENLVDKIKFAQI